MQCKVFEFVGFDENVPADNNDVPAAVLFWRKEINSTEVLEEHLSNVDFTLFQTFIPPLLWVKGGADIEKEETSVVDLTENVSLNTRNTSEIQKATDQMKSPCASALSVEAKNPNVEKSPQVLEDENDVKQSNNSNGNEGNTTTQTETDDRNRNEEGAADGMSALGMGGVEDNYDNNTYFDGDEKITVHTAHCPLAVLNSERKLVEHLAVLYDIRSSVTSRSITVGDNKVELYSFHYPDENLEAPKNDKQRTYVDKNDLPSLFAYDWKNALCTRVQRVSEYINKFKELNIYC